MILLGIATIAQEPSIILFLQNGMGPTQLEFARYVEYGAQQEMVFKKLDDIHMLSTQNSLDELTDCAAVATAMSCGVKTHNKNIAAVNSTSFCTNFIEYIHANFKTYKTGVVTKSHAGHQSPASFIAHSFDQNNLSDIYHSIATASRADLILSAYHKEIENNKEAISQKYKFINYTQVWNDKKILNTTNLPYYATVTNKSQLDYFIDLTDASQELTYEDLVFTALEKLRYQPFFLLVESPLLDLAGHSGNLSQAAGEVIEADKLLQKLKLYIEKHPELNINLLFTGDHETGGLAFYDTMKKLKTEIPLSNESINAQQQKRIKRIKEMPHNEFTSTGHTNAQTVCTGYGQYFNQNKLAGLKHVVDIRKVMEQILKNNYSDTQTIQYNNYVGKHYKNQQEMKNKIQTQGLVSGLILCTALFGVFALGAFIMK